MWWNKPTVDVDALLKEFLALKTKVSGLELEWLDAQDKMTRRLRALAATYSKMAQSEPTLTTESAPALSESDLLTLGRLPPAQRAIQEQIIRRRRAAANGVR